MKVSVLTITYNHERFIAQALESALKQETDFDYEIVVGEDCSTDSTRSIVVDYAKRYPEKIRPVLHARNLGLMGKGNFVATLKACQGQYIAYLEGDDYWTSPIKLQKQVRFLDRNPGCPVCGHWVQTVDISGSPLVRQPWSGRNCPEWFGLEHALTGIPVHVGSWVFPGDILRSIPREELKLFSRLLAGDNPLMLIMTSRGQGYCFQDCMGVYRIHQGSSWSAKAELLKRFGRLQFYCAIPRLLGVDLASIHRARIDHLVTRAEEKLSEEISRNLGFATMLEFAGVVKDSGFIPVSRFLAALTRVPLHVVRRTARGALSVARNLLRPPGLR